MTFDEWFTMQNDTGVLTSSDRELMRHAYAAGMRGAADIARRSSFIDNDMVADSIERAAEREEQ